MTLWAGLGDLCWALSCFCGQLVAGCPEWPHSEVWPWQARGWPHGLHLPEDPLRLIYTEVSTQEETVMHKCLPDLCCVTSRDIEKMIEFVSRPGWTGKAACGQGWLGGSRSRASLGVSPDNKGKAPWAVPVKRLSTQEGNTFARRTQPGHECVLLPLGQRVKKKEGYHVGWGCKPDYFKGK